MFQPSRRSVLTGVTTVGLLTACTPDEPDETDEPAPASHPDPDVVVATEALAAQTALLALLGSLTRGRPKRAQLLAGTRSVHLAHQKLLVEAVPAGTSTPIPAPGQAFAGTSRDAMLAVARAEDALGQQLRRSAFRARSGPFARVLAGMAAASAQQSVVLRGLA